ncbi:MAG: hypothetical protein LJE70_15460 [Chromatiaceae bacterium]|nr:hypothetical protein [Chromatiaceae bacterium]
MLPSIGARNAGNLKRAPVELFDGIPPELGASRESAPPNASAVTTSLNTTYSCALVPCCTLFCMIRAPKTRQGKAQSAGNSRLYFQGL